MADPRDRPPPSFEIPDLDLAPAKAPTKPPSASARPASAQRHDLDLGDEGDDFELESVQASLGFGMDTSSEHADVSRSLASRDDGQGWPSGAPPSARDLAVDHEDVERLADFGTPDAPLVLLPLYTARVFARRRELAALLRETSAALVAAETRRDTILSEIAIGKRAELAKHDGFAQGLAELTEAEKLAGEQEQSLAATSAQVSSRLAELDDQIAELRAGVEKARTRESDRSKHLEGCEANLKRAEARVKRVQIEIRALRDVAIRRAEPDASKPPPASVPLTAEEAARLAELEEQQRRLGEDALVVKGPFLTAQAELEAVRRELRELEQRIRGIERQKSSFSHKARAELNSKGEQASRASARLLAAGAELGRGVLAAGGRVALDSPTLERVRSAEYDVLRSARQHELHRLAHDAYDREKAKRGLLIALGAVALLLAALVWLLV